MTVLPYEREPGQKKAQVGNMFDNIAPKYDFLNHFLSFGVDKWWRKRVIRLLKSYTPLSILDIATGTADLAIAATKLHPRQIVGVDISQRMLDVGNKKLEVKQLNGLVSLVKGDSENLPFDEGSFDAVMAAFGVRNFEDMEKGLSEMYRVLNRNGVVMILEFSNPKKFPVKQLYRFYSGKILPVIGKLISGDYAAYTYLPKSVQAFPDDEKFLDILGNCGFKKNIQKKLSGGIASIYIGHKI